MESELDLNDIIQEMHVIATMPDLYHLLVELNAVQSLLGLLGHDNTDILPSVNQLSPERLSADSLCFLGPAFTGFCVCFFSSFPLTEFMSLYFFFQVKAFFVQVILILRFSVLLFCFPVLWTFHLGLSGCVRA